MTLVKVRALLFCPLVYCSMLWGQSGDYEFKLGHRYTRAKNIDSITDQNWSYFEAKVNQSMNRYWSAYGEIRPTYEHEQKELDWNIRELYIKADGDSFRMSFGHKIYSWSESFGVNIMDLANPRDYKNFIFDDPKYYKIPNLAFDLLYSWGDSSVELIFIPEAKRNELPDKNDLYSPIRGTPFVIVPYADDYRPIEDTEFFTRVGHLFSQNTAVQKNPMMSEITDVSQGILGLDYNFEGGHLFGAQYLWESYRQNQWGIFLARASMFDGNLVPEIMCMVGLNVSEVWVKPSLKFFLKNFQIQAWADIISGTVGEEGLFDTFDQSDRYGLELQLLL
jgi:hypothetical protein